TPAFEHLVDRYARPGAFESTSNWYRAGAGYVASALAEQAPERGARLTIPVRVLWQELDPLFPRAWADRLGDFFADVTVLPVDGIGHFTPVEAPREFAAVVKAASEACSSTRPGNGARTKARWCLTGRRGHPRLPPRGTVSAAAGWPAQPPDHLGNRWQPRGDQFFACSRLAHRSSLSRVIGRSRTRMPVAW
ncbi:MAG: epoxide hydrolase, partial [Actinomycetia bacterium]|nr:epoxide hydrolase [Actinomycetes bacterium]